MTSGDNRLSGVSQTAIPALAVQYKGRVYAVRGLRQGGKDTLSEITDLASLIEDLQAMRRGG